VPVVSYCSRRVEADVRLMSDARPSDFNTFTLLHRQDKTRAAGVISLGADL
jgi:hypothetical protein